MAVHDQNNNPQAQQAPITQQPVMTPPPQAAQPNFQFGTHQDGEFNLDDLIGGGISPLAPIADSAKLTELQTALREVLSKDGGKTLLSGFAVDIVDAATARTKGSAVLVSHATKNGNVLNIAVVTCILETSVEDQAAIQYVFNQRTYELAPTAGSSWNNNF